MNLTLKNLTVEQAEAVLKTLKKYNYEPAKPKKSADGEPEPGKPKE